ncbi:MAG: MASE1 domain-containing protein [Caulobacteraceae bacterium]|nr:MASE1 domain-containing protein [Caulobacteraceae bacterium]
MSETMHQPFLDVKPRRRDLSLGAIVALNLLVALIYTVTGDAGLRLAFVGQAVTLFWPPTGIAFAAIWLGGSRLLPGIALGAFLVNLVALKTPQLAAVVAFGNMLPALAATETLRRLISVQRAPWELRRVLLFIFVAALGSTMISATFGALAVSVMGKVGGSPRSTWLVWWLGDAMGVLIMAPPILLWRRYVPRMGAWLDWLDAIVLTAAGFTLIAALFYIRAPIWAVELCKLLTLLLILWSGARFGLAGPAAMTLLMAMGAIGVTMSGGGPYVHGDFYDSFALVHSHLFANALAGMLLAAALADLRAAVARERQARQLAEAEAASRIRFLTMISHDVRTPLTGMMGVLQTLNRSPLEAEPKRLVELGLRAGSTLTKLVNDILDLARADAGHIRLDPAPFSPLRSLLDVIEIHSPAAAAKGVSLTLTGAQTLPAQLNGDRVRFEQLLGNLVGNAVAYTDAGRVTIAADWRAAEGGELTIEVIDTGPGMDEARARRIFESFDLAPRPSATSAGLGLGLQICGRLVRLMGGQISHRAGPEGGSCFRMILPLTEARPAPEDAAPPPPTPLRILLVEDDEIAGETTQALLRSHGHTVRLAADLRAAVSLASASAFDIVLMDIQLGSAADAGIETARRIRALARPTGAVTIVALTSHGAPAMHEAFLAAGMDAVLVKPLTDAAQLVSLLRSERIDHGDLLPPRDTD